MAATAPPHRGRNLAGDPESPQESYAQVPPPEQRFGPIGSSRPGPLDAPFAVSGTVSDQDIVAAVDLVRAEPPEDRSSPKLTRLPDGPNGEKLTSFDPGLLSSVDHALPIYRLAVTLLTRCWPRLSTGTASRSSVPSVRQKL